MTGPIVIVGAGQAGGRCAETLRALGFDGAIHLIGAEPGLPYERPPLSKAVLAGTAQPEDALVVPAQRWAELGVTHHEATRVSTIDRAGRRVALAGGGHLDYGALVLATGVSPRRLNLQGAALPGVHTLHDADEARALRDRLAASSGRLVVIGGGFVGLEVAASAIRRGWQVQVLEQAPRCLARVLPDVASAWLVATHRACGVHVRCGVDLLAITGSDRVEGVSLRDGSQIAADAVVMAVGSLPNDALAAAAGLRVDQGILTDADGRTDDPAIWAIGDVTRRTSRWARGPLRLESWHNAETMAARAAHALLGRPVPDEPLPWFWTDQYDDNLQMLGLPDAQMTAVTRAGPGPGRKVVGFLAGERLAAAVLCNSGQDRRALARLIEAGGAIDAGRFADPHCPLAQVGRAAA